MTPYYRGGRHWSKPPLHFILPFPLYKLNLFSNIHAARLSIVFLTILILLLTSIWLKRYYQIELHTSFLFMATSVGMIKYARIFMMEIPLSLITFLGSLYFYTYYTSNRRKYLLWSSILIGLSIWVKGPVSYVLSMFSIGVFWLLDCYVNKKIFNLSKILKVASISLAIGSIWFVVSYINYGNEFFDYFFLRENLGKFSTKSYPIRHVFQGLIIFTLPWSLFIPFCYLRFKDNFNKNDLINKSSFLLIHAFFFFVIWLIPSQRSHHYAMPAVPFVLVLLLTILVRTRENTPRFKVFNFSNTLVGIGSLLIVAVLSVATYYVRVILPDRNLTFFMLSTIALLLLCSVTFIKAKNLTFKSLSSLVFICWVWSFVAPQFIPTFIPEKVISIIGQQEVHTSVKKPYFVEEALGRKIIAYDPSRPSDFIQDNEKNRIYITSYEDFINFKLKESTEVLHMWSIWRRRTRVKQIFHALNEGDIQPLRQKYMLFKRVR